MGLPAPTDRWMTESEYRSCWQATNLQKYFQYSISPLSTIPAAGAVDVLLNLLATQSALQSQPGLKVAGSGLDAIFGHAETLLPVFALLGIPGATSLPHDWNELSSAWSDAILTPLAANLAIIYSVDSRGNLYASMRLNGRNISPVNDARNLPGAGPRGGG